MGPTASQSTVVGLRDGRIPVYFVSSCLKGTQVFQPGLHSNVVFQVFFFYYKLKSDEHVL